jgi:hypothetical protein
LSTFAKPKFSCTRDTPRLDDQTQASLDCAKITQVQLLAYIDSTINPFDHSVGVFGESAVKTATPNARKRPRNQDCVNIAQDDAHSPAAGGGKHQRPSLPRNSDGNKGEDDIHCQQISKSLTGKILKGIKKTQGQRDSALEFIREPDASHHEDLS